MDSPEKLLSDLVAIDSINPDLVPGASGEGAIANFVADWLLKAGLEVQLYESFPGRPNVVAIARGSGGGKDLLLNGHLDTVGIEGMPNALQPVVREGRLYGRGAYDMKAGVAACMLAIANARQLNLRGDVIFCGVVDEEFAGQGTQTLSQHVFADGAIVAEPTHLELIVAHKGFVWLDVETSGVAAHGSRPDLGVDAIAKMGAVLSGLEALQNELQTRSAHPLLGHGSVHASLIQGGQEFSTYPQSCQLSIERRTLPAETAAEAQAEIEKILQTQRHIDPNFQAVVRSRLARVALETSQDAQIVQVVSQSAAQVTGQPPKLAGVAYWTDAATLWNAGIPSVLFGPSGAGAHANEEWADLDSLQACARIYLQTARLFCA